MLRMIPSWILSLVGAGVGAVLGYLVFDWLLGQGFYAAAIPGMALGLGAGLPARNVSVLRGSICGVAALLLGFFSEWHLRPFVRDRTLGFFLTHLDHLSAVSWIMLLLGGVLGFWFAR